MSRGPIEGVLDGTLAEIREGVSWDDYCSIAGLNPSVLVHGLRSMKHLHHAWHADSTDSPAMAWGRAVHCLLFEPRTFEQRFVKCDMVRNHRHKAYQDFLADNPGKEVLSVAEWDSVLLAAESFVGDYEVQGLIRQGVAEVTVLSVEEGMQCKHRLDWLATPTAKIIGDLKSTKNIEARRASQDFYKYKYDVKLGLYQRAMRQVTGHPWPVEVIWLENVPPYDVAVMPIDDAVLDRGARKGLEIIRKVKDCIERDEWPGVGGEDFILNTPSWEMDDEEVDYEGVAA